MYNSRKTHKAAAKLLQDRQDVRTTDVIATPIGAEGTSVSFNVNRVIHLDEYMKENFSFVLLFSPTK